MQVVVVYQIEVLGVSGVRFCRISFGSDEAEAINNTRTVN